MGKILVVSDRINGFFANSVCAELEKKGLIITRAGIDNEILLDLIKDSKVVLALLSDDFDAHSIFASSLAKKCFEFNKKLIAFGSNDKISDIKSIWTDDSFIAAFTRPMDNGTMVDRFKVLLEKLERIGDSKVQKHILVVDDSGPMLRTIMRWLEGKYRVSLANSAANAAVALEKEIPDLILLDYEMPEKSGAEFLKEIRENEQYQDIPVIFLTAKNDTDSVREVLALKPQGYILKTEGAKAVEKIDSFFSL